MSLVKRPCRIVVDQKDFELGMLYYGAMVNARLAGISTSDVTVNTRISVLAEMREEDEDGSHSSDRLAIIDAVRFNCHGHPVEVALRVVGNDGIYWYVVYISGTLREAMPGQFELFTPDKEAQFEFGGSDGYRTA